ncbi:hypothetical protein [Pseudomonas putida]|uniref:hypothetical protein n=1 Tax=Pseudomonas putida TaxID=303 RepID=UPI0039DFC520
MHTTASLHVHPAAASTDLIFKIRRLAKQHGCAFGTTKRSATTAFRPMNPDDGGHAA